MTTEVLLEKILASLTSSMKAALSLDGVLVYIPLILVFVLIIEAFYVGFRNSTLNNIQKVSRTDIILYLIMQFNLITFLNFAITGGVIYFVFAGARELTSALNIENLKIESVIFYFLVIDFMKYWQHRLSHRLPSLWALHHVHHSAPEPNIFNAFRFHPLESAITRIFIVIPISAIFFPVSPSLSLGVFTYLCFITLLTALQHSKIKSDFGWVGKVIVSPADHLIHHSSNPLHFNKNFGNTLIIWDKLFQTYHSARLEHIASIKIGLDDYDFNSSVIEYLWSTYKKAILHIVTTTIVFVRRNFGQD